MKDGQQMDISGGEIMVACIFYIYINIYETMHKNYTNKEYIKLSDWRE